MLGAAGQPLFGSCETIDPDRSQAEDGSAVDFPGIRRLERDGAGRHVQPIDRELIDRGVRLVDVEVFDGQDVVEQPIEPRRVDRGVVHGGVAVGEDGGLQAGRLQAREHRRHFGVGVQGEVGVHQPVADRGGIDAGAGQRVIEGVAGDLPEILVRPIRARSQVYSSCLVRQSFESSSAFGPISARSRPTAEWTSNSVP